MNKNKLKQIESIGKQLNAIVTMIQDPQIDKMAKEGHPFYGEMIAVKDNFSTKDILTKASCRILDNYVPIFDATVIKKLKQAGLVMVCKTTMDELAMGGSGLTPSQGPTKNPFNEQVISGGSSSGSAALVGAGVIDLALGSDTGDSIRKPASYCGCIGVKPSYGRISRYGIIPYASSLDHVGFFSRTVKQSALLLEILAGRDPQDMTSSYQPVDHYSDIRGDLKGKKIAVIDNILDAHKEDVSKKEFLIFLDRLQQEGVEIKHVYLDAQLLDAILTVYYVIANCEATANHANLDGIRFGVGQKAEDLTQTMIQSRSKGFGDLLKKRFVIGSYGLDDAHQEEIFRKAQKIRRLLVEEYKKAFEDVDGVLVPASHGVAPNIDDESVPTKTDILVDNHLVLQNFSGYPSITLPFGFDKGLPFGINLTMPLFEEKKMFDMALGLEQLIDFESKRKEVQSWITK